MRKVQWLADCSVKIEDEQCNFRIDTSCVGQILWYRNCARKQRKREDLSQYYSRININRIKK